MCILRKNVQSTARCASMYVFLSVDLVSGASPFGTKPTGRSTFIPSVNFSSKCLPELVGWTQSLILVEFSLLGNNPSSLSCASASKSPPLI